MSPPATLLLLLLLLMLRPRLAVLEMFMAVELLPSQALPARRDLRRFLELFLALLPPPVPVGAPGQMAVTRGPRCEPLLLAMCLVTNVLLGSARERLLPRARTMRMA